jgi:hypothetical protein
MELPTKRRMGRRKEFDESLRVPLAAGTTARMDAVLEPDEPRLTLIREAIEREIKRRERITRNPASQRDRAK